MALAEEPLRYLRKYLNVEEDLTEEIAAATASDSPDSKPPKARRTKPAAKPTKTGRTKPLPRPLPTGTPAFLTRPFK
jgi:hypothetical protein